METEYNTIKLNRCFTDYELGTNESPFEFSYSRKESNYSFGSLDINSKKKKTKNLISKLFKGSIRQRKVSDLKSSSDDISDLTGYIVANNLKSTRSTKSLFGKKQQAKPYQIVFIGPEKSGKSTIINSNNVENFISKPYHTTIHDSYKFNIFARNKISIAEFNEFGGKSFVSVVNAAKEVYDNIIPNLTIICIVVSVDDHTEEKLDDCLQQYSLFTKIKDKKGVCPKVMFIINKINLQLLIDDGYCEKIAMISDNITKMSFKYNISARVYGYYEINSIKNISSKRGVRNVPLYIRNSSIEMILPENLLTEVLGRQLR